MAFAVWGAADQGSGVVEARLWVWGGLLDAPGGGGADALVDRERMPQVRGGLAGVGVLEVGLAESFQGACFLERSADITRNGERLRMTIDGLLRHQPASASGAGRIRRSR